MLQLLCEAARGCITEGREVCGEREAGKAAVGEFLGQGVRHPGRNYLWWKVENSKRGCIGWPGRKEGRRVAERSCG